MDETKFKETGDFTMAEGHGHPLVLIKRAIDEEPLYQMIKLEINKQIGKKQFHGCHLWLNVPKMELLKSSGVGKDTLKNYGVSQVG